MNNKDEKYFICHDGKGNIDIIKTFGFNNYKIIYNEISDKLVFKYHDEYIINSDLKYYFNIKEIKEKNVKITIEERFKHKVKIKRNNKFIKYIKNELTDGYYNNLNIHIDKNFKLKEYKTKDKFKTIIKFLNDNIHNFDYKITDITIDSMYSLQLKRNKYDEYFNLEIDLGVSDHE